LVHFRRDSALETAADRRVKQGRGDVLSTCCRVLNPLEALPCEDGVTCATYVLTELLLRSGEVTRLYDLQDRAETLLLGSDPGFQVALARIGVHVVPVPLTDCLDSIPRTLLPGNGSSDLCVGCGIPSDLEGHAHSTLAQFVTALHRLRPGGTLVLRLTSLDGSIVTGLLYAAVRWFFTGSVVLCKPEASRPDTEEVFLVACGRAGQEEVSAAKGPTLSKLVAWLDRIAPTAGTVQSGNVRVFHREEDAPPFGMVAGFGACVNYWSARYTLLRQKTTRHALDLCRIVIEHRPIVRRAQLQNLLTACAENVALRELAKAYMARWSLPVVSLLQEEQLGETLMSLQALPFFTD
jgi:hypothetical protein